MWEVSEWGREKSEAQVAVAAMWLCARIHDLGLSRVIGEVGVRTVQFDVFWAGENFWDFEQRWISGFFRVAFQQMNPFFALLFSVSCCWIV